MNVKLDAKQLRAKKPSEAELKKLRKNPIYIILDNVLDTYNIGSIFRLADAVAAEKIYLCAETETPPNPRIKKASINTWQWVSWQYADTASAIIEDLKFKIENLFVVAVEQHEKSISLKDFKPSLPIAIVVGNETYGVSKNVLRLADEIVELPMFGINKSLNVMVSCGIVLYKIVEFC